MPLYNIPPSSTLLEVEKKMVRPKATLVTVNSSDDTCFSPSSQAVSEDEKQNTKKPSHNSTQTSYWKFLAAKLPMSLEVGHDLNSSCTCDRLLRSIPESIDDHEASNNPDAEDHPRPVHRAIPQIDAAMNIVSDNPKSHKPKQSSLRSHSFPAAAGKMRASVSAPVMKSQSRWSPIPMATPPTASNSQTSRGLSAAPPSPPDSRNARWAASSSSNSITNSSPSGFHSPGKLRQMGLDDLRKKPLTSNATTHKNHLKSTASHSNGRESRWNIPSNHSDSMLIYPKRGGSTRRAENASSLPPTKATPSSR